MEAQAKVVRAGVAGQELVKQILEVVTGLGGGENHLLLYGRRTPEKIWLDLLHLGSQFVELPFLMSDGFLHRLIDF